MSEICKELLKEDCTFLVGDNRQTMDTLLQAAALLSDQGGKALVVLSHTKAQDFAKHIERLEQDFEVSGVSVVKMSGFMGTYEDLPKDANKFDRVFFESVNSEEELNSIPLFVGVKTFRSLISLKKIPEWLEGLHGVSVNKNGEGYRRIHAN